MYTATAARARQIAVLERNLSTYRSNLTTYRANLQKMEEAKNELEVLHNNYWTHFHNKASAINKNLAMYVQGLKGVEKIQAATCAAYTLNKKKEQSFSRAVDNWLKSIKTKMKTEENKISNCHKSIRTTEDDLYRLRAQL